MEKYKEHKWSGEKGKKFGKEDDPYLPAGGRHEMAICTTCKAVYKNKRWLYDEDLYREHFPRRPPTGSPARAVRRCRTTITKGC